MLSKVLRGLSIKSLCPLNNSLLDFKQEGLLNNLKNTREYSVLFNLYNEVINSGYTEDEILMSTWYAYEDPKDINDILCGIADLRDLINK